MAFVPVFFTKKGIIYENTASEIHKRPQNTHGERPCKGNNRSATLRKILSAF